MDLKINGKTVTVDAKPDDILLWTLRDAPKVEAVLVDSGQTEPYGVGEPPIAPIAAAIGNAVFALTGKRLRQMPFTSARVRAAEVTG